MGTISGYAQYEIANLLHISQPTISRDIHYVQKEIKKSTENYGEHLFETYRNTLLGLDEAIKKLWVIVDAINEQDYSIFTHYLLKGLKHNAESVTKDDIITLDSLSSYMIDKVTKLPSKKRPIRKPKKSF